MDELVIHEHPALNSPRMVLGFDGWMNAGNVSTGVIEHLIEDLQARPVAEILPLDFYILNFPVSTIPFTVFIDGEGARVSSISPMQFSAIFRPHAEIKDGVVEQFAYQQNEFLYTRDPDLIIFRGEEPHIRWGSYADCVLRLAEEFGVTEMYFTGSVSSPIPHTREPRLRCSAANEDYKQALRGPDVRFTDYSGPSSLITLLTGLAADRGIALRNLVVEVPHYPFIEMPSYPASIAKVASKLHELVQAPTDLTELQQAAGEMREQLDKLMDDNEEFKELVAKLEQSYDYEEHGADEALLRRLIEGIDLRGDADHN